VDSNQEIGLHGRMDASDDYSQLPDINGRLDTIVGLLERQAANE
jgi:hypothetical protein